MAENDDFASLLGQLFSADSSTDKGGEESSDGGIFGNIDPETILKLLDIFSKLNSPDKNTELLMALKPHLRTENRAKLERAATLLKIISLLPLLKDLGSDNNIF